MTVDKIFEALGYRKVDYNSPHTNEVPYFEWWWEKDKGRKRIRFVPDTETVYVVSTYNSYHVPTELSLEEITAIHMQCVELGWKI